MVPGAMLQLGAKFVPGAGLVSMIYQGVSFLFNNHQTLAGIFNGFGNAIYTLLTRQNGLLNQDGFKNAIVCRDAPTRAAVRR